MRQSSLEATATAAAATTVMWGVARRQPMAARSPWTKINYRGKPVTLALGPAVAAGATLGAARAGRGQALLAAAAGLVGLYDDVAGDSHARGLVGHLRALRAGRVTTGMIKLGVISAAALTAAASRRRSAIDTLLDGTIIAACSNLVNLFDLRPGRAAKVVLIATVTGTGWVDPAAAAAMGAAAAALIPDVSELAMMGDSGAGTLGALVGWGLSAPSGRRYRTGMAAGVTALILSSERVSFTAVIERRPWLAALDDLGRPS